MAGSMPRAEALDFSGALLFLLMVFVPVIDAFSQVKATLVMTEFASNSRRGLINHVPPMLFGHCFPPSGTLPSNWFARVSPPRIENSIPTPGSPVLSACRACRSLQRLTRAFLSSAFLPPLFSADPIQQKNSLQSVYPNTFWNSASLDFSR